MNEIENNSKGKLKRNRRHWVKITHSLLIKWLFLNLNDFLMIINVIYHISQSVQQSLSIKLIKILSRCRYSINSLFVSLTYRSSLGQLCFWMMFLKTKVQYRDIFKTYIESIILFMVAIIIFKVACTDSTRPQLAHNYALSNSGRF